MARLLALVRVALQAGPGRYALQAAIAAVHADAATWAETDRREIVALYVLLEVRWGSPVVALNRAVPIGLVDGPAAGLRTLDRVRDDPALASYGYLPAARTDFLRRLGRTAGGRAGYEQALQLTAVPAAAAGSAVRVADSHSPSAARRVLKTALHEYGRRASGT